MICLACGHYARPDREMDHAQRSTDCACECHPWNHSTPGGATRTQGRDMRRAGRERGHGFTPSRQGVSDGPQGRRYANRRGVSPVRVGAAHCGETAHIRSGSGCGAVGPRHRAGPGVQRAAGGTAPRCVRRPGRLVRGRQTVSRRAHNPERPSSILGPAIDRGDTSARAADALQARVSPVASSWRARR